MLNRLYLLPLLLSFSLSAGLDLYPAPRIYIDKGELWPVTAGTQIVIGNAAPPSDTFAAFLLCLDIKNMTGLDVAVVREGGVTAPAGKRIVIGDPARDTLLARLCAAAGLTITDSISKIDSFYLRREGYALDCGTDILIAAPSDHGVFYGTKTLFQLMDTGSVIHKIRAEDWPSLPFRAYMLDCGRAPYKINQVKRLIRLWSRMKINTFQIHLHDDQLNGLQYRELPLGRENPRAWTMDQLAEVIAYAKQYHVEVIPELECIGHSGSLIYWYPQLNGATGMSRSFNTADTNLYRLYEAMFNEVIPLIQSGYLHVGTDESTDASPRYYFFDRLWKVVDKLNRRHGKDLKLIQWTGPAVCPDTLADRIVIMPWDYTMTGTDTSVHDGLYDLIHNGKQRVLGGAAGWMDVPRNPMAWAQRFHSEPNFYGVAGTNWSLNNIDQEHNQWMSTGTYCWNPHASDTMAWSALERRMPEMRNPPSLYTDVFLTADDYVRPNTTDTPCIVQDGIYTSTRTPVAPTALGFDADTMLRHPIPDPADTLPIVSMRLYAPATAILAFQSFLLSVIMTYTNGTADTNTRGAWFVSQDTLVATVGRLTGVGLGRDTGTVRIAAEKRGRRDTLTLTIGAPVAVVDSLKMSVKQCSLVVSTRAGLFVTLFCHDNDSAFTVVSRTAAAWISDSPSVAAVSPDGWVAGMGPGGPVSIVASAGGKSDTTKIMVYPLPPVIRRINFQCWTAYPFRPGWDQDNGGAYDSTRGFGWERPQSTCRNDRGGATFLTQSLVRPDVETGYRVDIPDGDYLLRIGVGDNAWGNYPGYVLVGADTFISRNYSTNFVRTDTVTVEGGQGLNLRINGAMNYLVLASQAGTPLDLVANDGVVAVDLGSSGVKGTPVQKTTFAFRAVPNPFNPSTRFDVTLPPGERGQPHLFIYDLKGRLVGDLTQAVHDGRAEWRPMGAASGLYIAVLRTNKRLAVRQVLFIK